ncbi:ABC transporter substrate-binding protein [Rhodovastum atsumiense]|uniref:ABC transporter substrate-binding protein n=1 Tax=Rhodovastum atsumiense TaxID=504468 RepID=A0A5M6IXL8_9PROT|nr:ABC transporter substrate-binding protein [Rhodovastum atsumiense]KAA5612138.1 ABC transporter substrate-binding protein [Rhodovastum atsumiense]CAH2603919.1 ABC transporter substrate-binding protein [Rhodovastum atsumiense]
MRRLPFLRHSCPLFALAFAAALPAIAAAAEQPRAGGVLRVAIDTDPQCLDPQQAGNNNSLNIGRQIVDSLTDQHPDTGEIVPWLATAWTLSPDSRSFTFTLRPGVTFSDGTPVDAAAVRANFEGIVALGARSTLGAGYLAGLQAIETPDPRTVVIRFAQPNVQFLQATSTMSLGLLAPATLAKSPEDRCQGQLIGSGPFVVASFVHNQQARITRRDGYAWPSALAAHAGPAYLDAIEYRVVPEAGVRSGSLLSGQIDVNTGVPPQDEAVLLGRNIPLLARGNPGVVYTLYPNESVAPLSEPAVRRAINKAIDRPALRPILSRFQAVATAPLARTTPLYSDLSPLLAHDPDGARALLDGAGWRVGPDGVRVRDGQRLSFRLDYWQFAPFLELVQQQLRDVGIELRLNRTTIAQVTAIQTGGSFPVRFANLTRADPDILRAVFGVGERNMALRQADATDDLLTRSSGTPDRAARAELIRAASIRLIEDGHSIPIVELATIIGTGRQVRGLHFEASSRLQFYDTWLAR